MYGYLREGAVAGLVGGAVYGAYVALVGTPLVAHAEHLAGHGGDGGHDHAGEGAGLVAEGTVQTVSAAGSVARPLAGYRRSTSPSSRSSTAPRIESYSATPVAVSFGRCRS